MANKCMKRCSISLAIRKTQIKSTVRCHLAPAMAVTVKKRQNKKKGWRGGVGTLVHGWWEVKWGSHRGNSRAVPLTVKYRITIWLSNFCASVFTQRKRAQSRDTCTPIVTVAVCTTAKWGNRQSVRQQITGKKCGLSTRGMLCSHKEEWGSDTGCSVDEPWTQHAEWIKPVAKGQTLYYFMGVKYLEWANSSRWKVD